MRVVPGPCVGGDCRLTAEADCPTSLPSPRSLKDRGGFLQYHPLKATGRGQGTQVLEMSSLGLQISLGLSDLLGQLFPAVAEPIQAERLCYSVKQSFIWTDTLGCLKGPSARQQKAFRLCLYVRAIPASSSQAPVYHLALRVPLLLPPCPPTPFRVQSRQALFLASGGRLLV